MKDDEKRQLEAVRQDLLREFAGRLPTDRVTACFEAVLDGFRGAPVRTYVPVLARRQVRQELVQAS